MDLGCMLIGGAKKKVKAKKKRKKRNNTVCTTCSCEKKGKEFVQKVSQWEEECQSEGRD